MFHGITTGFQPVGVPQLTEHAAFLATQQQVAWIDTAGRISRYVIEAVSAKLTVTGNPGDLTIVLGDDLGDAKLFDQPLTLIINAQAAAVTATRGKSALPATAAADRILVDAVPGPEPIRVRW